ncbi:MAG: hypothetical protein ACRCZD_04910 [Phycicoccus sp.]
MSEKRTAGAFDIRDIIGMPLVVYGVLLTATGPTRPAPGSRAGAGR